MSRVRVALLAMLAGLLLAMLAVQCTNDDSDNGTAVFGDPQFGPDILEVDSCGEIPESAVQRGAAFAESEDGSERRAIVRFSDSETAQSYALTLRSDRDLPGDCPDEILRLVEEPAR